MNDPTSQASWISGVRTQNTGGLGSQGVVVNSPEEYTRLMQQYSDIEIAQYKKVLEAKKRLFISLSEEESKWTKQDLEKYMKDLYSMSSQLGRAMRNDPNSIFGIISGFKDYKKALNDFKSGVNTEVNGKTAASLAGQLGTAVGRAVRKAVDFVVNQYTKYAQNYSQYLPSTSTNLGANRSGYSGLLQGANKEIFSQGVASATSMTQVMQAMDQLAASGISSNLESLSVLKSMESLISTTFNSSSIMDQIRRRGSDSGIYELSLGSEAMLRDVLQEQFGDSQYISNGMFNLTKLMADAMLATASSSEKSIELEYSMQESLGQLYELGLSQAGITSAQQMLQKIAEGDIAGLEPGQIKAVMDAGGFEQFMGKDIDPESIYNLMYSYGDLYNQLSTDNRLVANAIANAWGIGSTYDYMNGVDVSQLTQEVVDAGTIEDYLAKQKEDAINRQTFQQNVENYLKDIVGVLGGNYLSQAGEGIIGRVGSVASGLLGTIATVGATSLLGKSAISSLGKSGTTLSIGTRTLGLGSKLIGGLGIAGGLLGGALDANTAVQEQSYGSSKAANIAGGAFLGNSVLGNTAKYATLGAGIGSLIPGVGTLIGGAIGGVAGLITGGIGEAIRNKKSESTEEVSAAANSSTSDYSSILSTINDSINIQTDKLIAAITNIYKVVATPSISGTGVSIGDYA